MFFLGGEGGGGKERSLFRFFKNFEFLFVCCIFIYLILRCRLLLNFSDWPVNFPAVPVDQSLDGNALYSLLVETYESSGSSLTVTTANLQNPEVANGSDIVTVDEEDADTETTAEEVDGDSDAEERLSHRSDQV